MADNADPGGRKLALGIVGGLVALVAALLIIPRLTQHAPRVPPLSGAVAEQGILGAWDMEGCYDQEQKNCFRARHYTFNTDGTYRTTDGLWGGTWTKSQAVYTLTADDNVTTYRLTIGGSFGSGTITGKNVDGAFTMMRGHSTDAPIDGAPLVPPPPVAPPAGPTTAALVGEWDMIGCYDAAKTNCFGTRHYVVKADGTYRTQDGAWGGTWTGSGSSYALSSDDNVTTCKIVLSGDYGNGTITGSSGVGSLTMYAGHGVELPPPVAAAAPKSNTTATLVGKWDMNGCYDAAKTNCFTSRHYTFKSDGSYSTPDSYNGTWTGSGSTYTLRSTDNVTTYTVNLNGSSGSGTIRGSSGIGAFSMSVGN